MKISEFNALKNEITIAKIKIKLGQNNNNAKIKKLKKSLATLKLKQTFKGVKSEN